VAKYYLPVLSLFHTGLFSNYLLNQKFLCSTYYLAKIKYELNNYTKKFI